MRVERLCEAKTLKIPTVRRPPSPDKAARAGRRVALPHRGRPHKQRSGFCRAAPLYATQHHEPTVWGGHLESGGRPTAAPGRLPGQTADHDSVKTCGVVIVLEKRRVIAGESWMLRCFDHGEDGYQETTQKDVPYKGD